MNTVNGLNWLILRGRHLRNVCLSWDQLKNEGMAFLPILMKSFFYIYMYYNPFVWRQISQNTWNQVSKQQKSCRRPFCRLRAVKETRQFFFPLCARAHVFFGTFGRRMGRFGNPIFNLNRSNQVYCIYEWITVCCLIPSSSSTATSWTAARSRSSASSRCSGSSSSTRTSSSCRAGTTSHRRWTRCTGSRARWGPSTLARWRSSSPRCTTGSRCATCSTSRSSSCTAGCLARTTWPWTTSWPSTGTVSRQRTVRLANLYQITFNEDFSCCLSVNGKAESWKDSK